jgi:hypothetical protein
MAMITVLIILVALGSAILFIELVAANRAPYGYQDETGFHFDGDHGAATKSFELENPS